MNFAIDLIKFLITHGMVLVLTAGVIVLFNWSPRK